jgi:hypothetical protein
MGFAGAAGLVASGLTDIASSMGPFLPWFCFIAAIATLLTALLIHRNEKRRTEERDDSPHTKAYCQSFLVLIGSLFGSIVLLISGMFAEDTSGSNILSLLNGIRGGVERIEEKVDTVSEGVEGLGENISVRDITGRSGTGKIGDDAVFAVALANERMMDGATCRLSLEAEWQNRISVLDDACASFTVKLPSAPLLDANGNSMGDVVPVPFELDVLDARGDKLASYASSYPFHNNYRTINIMLDPPGNRLSLDENRTVRVDVGDAGLPDTVECVWTVFDPVSIRPSSDNGCVAVLSTEVDRDAYVYKRLVDEGEIRDDIYVQINSIADFTMLGNATLRYAVRP